MLTGQRNSCSREVLSGGTVVYRRQFGIFVVGIRVWMALLAMGFSVWIVDSRSEDWCNVAAAPQDVKLTCSREFGAELVRRPDGSAARNTCGLRTEKHDLARVDALATTCQRISDSG
jgi:hypothetical protein